MKFPHLEIIVDLMKDLKYEHQSTFPLWGRSNLILGTGKENQMFILRTPATIKFFSLNSQKLTLWCKKKSLPIQMDLYDSYMFIGWVVGGGWSD